MKKDIHVSNHHSSDCVVKRHYDSSPETMVMDVLVLSTIDR